jgi:hypothetical protein
VANKEFMHEYTIEFRISGNDLNVSSVTDSLELEPSVVRSVGERRGETSEWEEALWSYNGFPASAGSKPWKSLEEGLTFVLEKLWPLRQKIDAYKGKFKLILWCGHFQSAADCGPTLSPGILKTLGDFGVELFIDNYFCEDLDSE